MIAAQNLTNSHIALAVKTAVTAVLSIYAANLLHLPQGYWGAMSAIVVMQSEVGATVSASRDRLIGTAIGAVAGALFGTLGSNVLWLGLASTLTILICPVLGLEQSYLLACVTVAIIMLVWAPGPPWSTAIHRFLEVELGIGRAFLAPWTWRSSGGSSPCRYSLSRKKHDLLLPFHDFDSTQCRAISGALRDRQAQAVANSRGVDWYRPCCRS